ncbi:uncharacterized protein LOC130663586 [Microplitis mediator]|uniref:uncharacterized protein LOC130663586 n=1 Tax=Microplitis mediator TaxID=375433 RepID=UPI002553304A|nr:uncharacterized protein LOC130663586 [Microplitis mediator]XP_057318877.1 uncharacterized protein LOC130663586 [Microplitis mediator]
MMLMKNIILSALFASVSCVEFKNSNLSPTNPPITHTNMAQLFELCFANTSNPIVITENLVETFHKNLSVTIKAPVVIINENFIAKDIQLYYPTYPMYILSVSSYAELVKVLLRAIRLPLRSEKSIFFVIYETENSCERSWEILATLWRALLLSCIVVCSRTGNETSLYTYNPITRRAPDPWVDISMHFSDNRNRPVFLYNQTFTNDYKICETLFFDKTKILDGYPVKVAKIGNNYADMNLTFDSLNIKQESTEFGIKDVHSLLALLNNGTYDVLAFYTVGLFHNFLHTVPLMYEGSFIVVTQNVNFRSASYEIANVLDINGAIAIIFILLLITLLIVLHNKYQVGLAVLDVLKLLMSMGINAPLDRLAMKITFFTGFFFVFLFSPMLVGQIFAVLSRPPTYNMESLKDLYDHKYHVYYWEGIHNEIVEKQLWKTDEDMKYLHLEYVSPGDCLKLLIENNTVACIFRRWELIDYAVKHNLHISKRFTLKVRGFYSTYGFWSLADRFYRKLLDLQELGYLGKIDNFYVNGPLKKKKAKERIKKIVDYHTIDAVDLTNLYVFMAFFQFLAIIVFGIEYIVGRHRRPRQ